MVNADLDADLVYEMTRLYLRTLEPCCSLPSAATITLEIAPNTSIPLHEGAAHYGKGCTEMSSKTKIQWSFRLSYGCINHRSLFHLYTGDWDFFLHG